jgi:hypothetical protein
MLSYTEAKKIIFKIDNDKEIFNYTFQGYPLYFIFRFIIEQKLYEDKNTGLSNPPSKAYNLSFSAINNFISKAFSFIKKKIAYPIYLNKFDALPDIKKSPVLFWANAYNLTDKGYKNYAFMNYYDIVNYFKNKQVPVNYIHCFSNPGFTKPSFIDVFLPMEERQTLSITTEQKETLQKFISYLTTITGINFTSEQGTYEKNLEKISYKKSKTVEYIKAVGCKYLFGISIFTEPWILMACHDTKIKSIELQHGPILEELPYFNSSLKNFENKLFFPDHILTLGDEWKKTLLDYNFIWDNNNTFTIGNSFFGKAMEERRKHPEKITKILVISQYGKFTIFNYVKELLERFGTDMRINETKIVCRPHPSESITNWKILARKYPDIVELEESRSVHIYQTFINIKVVIGSASTALYEAKAFGIPTYIFSAFEKLNMGNLFEPISNVEEFYKIIQDNTIKNTTEPKKFLNSFTPELLETFVN